MGQVKTFRNQLQSNCLSDGDRPPDRPSAGVTVRRTGVPRRPAFGLLCGPCPVRVSSVAKGDPWFAAKKAHDPGQPVTAALPVGRGSCRAVTSHTSRRFSRVSRFLLGFHVLPNPLFWVYEFRLTGFAFRLPHSATFNHGCHGWPRMVAEAKVRLSA